jgi:hypothetical protein
MTTLRTIFIVLSVLLVFFAGALFTRSIDPFIGFPGGGLSGVATEKPDQWGPEAQAYTVQVETRPADPYSVNLWGVAIGPDYYVATSEVGTEWSRNLDADPNVRLKISDAVYALQAVKVSKANERKRVSDAYLQKYDTDLAENIGAAGLIYRFDPPM